MSDDAQKLAELRISSIMSTETGREFAWWMLDSLNVFRNTFDHDPLKHAYNAGARSKGLELLDEIKRIAPDQYIQMLREHDLNE